MDPTKFTAAMPGQLVRTTGYDRRVVGGLEERVAVMGYGFVPDPLPPRIDRDRTIGRLYDAISAAERHLARLDATAMGLPNPHLLVAPFRQREAQLSSRIENTIATAEEVALVQVNRPPNSDAWEVWNYVRALEHGLSSPLPLCARLFNEMHAILLDRVRGDDKRPGEFRSVQAHISGNTERFADARFVPTPPGQMLVDGIGALETFLNLTDNLTPRFPRIVETAMAHYQFECLHPYRDGNGRLGRLLVALSLCKDGSLDKPLVYVSAYFDRHKQAYFNLLLRVSTHGEWEPWLRFFCEAVASQAADGLKRAKKLIGLRDSYIQKVTEPKASALLPKLINHLFEQPIVSIGDVAQLLGITHQGAQNIVERLVKKTILTEISGSNYAKLYAARDIFAAIEEELEAED